MYSLIWTGFSGEHTAGVAHVVIYVMKKASVFITDIQRTACTCIIIFNENWLSYQELLVCDCVDIHLSVDGHEKDTANHHINTSFTCTFGCQFLPVMGSIQDSV